MATIKITTNADMNADAASGLFSWALGVADHIVKFDDYRVRVGDLSVAGVAYLLSNGFNQSMGDSVAGARSGDACVAAAAKAATAAKPDTKRWLKFVAESGIAGSPDPGYSPDVENVTAAVVTKRRDKRYAAIIAAALAAKDGGDSGGRMSEKDAWIYAQAKGEIEAKAAKVGKELPKGGDLKIMVAKYAAHHADRFAGLWATHEAAVSGATDEILGF